MTFPGEGSRMGKEPPFLLEKRKVPRLQPQEAVKCWRFWNILKAEGKGMGQRYTWEGVGRRKVWFRKGEKRQAGHTGVELTFVFSRGSGLRAHGAAHKHPMAPVEGLIYQGDSWDTSAHGQR